MVNYCSDLVVVDTILSRCVLYILGFYIYLHVVMVSIWSSGTSYPHSSSISCWAISVTLTPSLSMIPAHNSYVRPSSPGIVVLSSLTGVTPLLARRALLIYTAEDRKLNPVKLSHIVFRMYCTLCDYKVLLKTIWFRMWWSYTVWTK